MIVGSSAEGSLAAALTQFTCDRGKIHLAHQLLLYPMLDPLNITQAGGDIDGTYYLDSRQQSVWLDNLFRSRT
ncbi:alpha/beta hydrolase fold domain-containing protein [Acaryochloris marina]|uniref:alpha/beta hydrolase fold domain-containing protein n=1 Tax=Acaryochloris marina TaxID=155978 RepID=UPI0008FFD2FC